MTRTFNYLGGTLVIWYAVCMFFYELYLCSSENPLTFYSKIGEHQKITFYSKVQEQSLRLLLKMPVMRRLYTDAKFLVNDLGKYLEKIFN